MAVTMYACVHCGALYHGDYINWNQRWHEGHARYVEEDEAACGCCGKPDTVERYTEIIIGQ